MILIETKEPTSAAVEISSPDNPVGRRSSTSRGKLASAVSLTGAGSLLTMVASSLAGIAVARNGGPSGYGIYVAVNMLIFVTAVLCSFGLPLALAKHTATEEELGHHQVLRRSFTTALILLLLVMLMIGVAMSINMPVLEAHLNVSIGRGFAFAFPLAILCAAISDFAQGIYIGLMRPGPAIVIAVSGPLVVIIYSFSRSVGAPLPIWGSVAALYVTSGIVAGCYLLRDRLLGRPCALRLLHPVFKDLVPAAAFTFFTIFSVWCDRWIVGTQLGEIAIGSYGAAVVVIQAALRVPKHIAYLLVSASTRVSLKGPEESKKLNRTTIKMFGLFAALITVIIMLGAGTIVRLLFGPGFVEAGPVLLIMAPGLLASAVSIPFVSVLTGSSKNRFVTYLAGLTIVPRIVLLFLFTRWWGLTGTALATVLADSLLAVACMLVAAKVGIIFPLGALVQPFMLGIFAYALGHAVMQLGAPLPVAIALAMLAFVWTVWKSLRAAYGAMPTRLDAKSGITK